MELNYSFMTTHTDFPIAISRIEQVLKEKKWSKTEFCDKLGVGTQHYNNWRSRGLPTSRERDVANLLGISVEWLVGETDIRDEVCEQPSEHLAEIDWDKFAAILEATSQALIGAGLSASTTELLELSEFFYELNPDSAPAKGAIIKAHDRFKRAAS